MPTSSVIEASSGTYRCRVDGTIVLSVEIEPRFRDAALQLFGMPGQPMALAALKVKRHDKPEIPTADTVGPLCMWAAQRCREQSFQQWIGLSAMHPGPLSNDVAKQIIYSTCNIKSRRELDTNDVAGATFKRKVMLPYAAWLEKQTNG